MTSDYPHWNDGFDAKRQAAQRLSSSMHHSKLGFTGHNGSQHPLSCLMVFYWFDQTLGARMKLGDSTDPGWMISEYFPPSDGAYPCRHHWWFIGLADLLQGKGDE